MDIRRITPDYAVSPQIAPEDFAALREAGFTTVINNRPDAEVGPELSSEAMRAAAEAAGLTYVENPVVNGGLTPQMVETQMQALADADGPVFAWCRTGTRCSIVWALGQAGQRPTEQIIAALQAQGYDVPGLDQRLEALAGN